MEKTLDRKLAEIHADPSGSTAFVLADAKDADMAFGVSSFGRSAEAEERGEPFRTVEEYRAEIRELVAQAAVDIMLMSASTNDRLAYGERLFDDSSVTPAARANDASDIFAIRGGRYVEQPSRPFRTATIDDIQCGRVECAAEERATGTNLGLYSITFNNRLDEDLASLEAYRRFRVEAEQKGFRHFLEVFDPNAAANLETSEVPRFVNDAVVRTLAGVPRAGRPLFLKMVYHGPKATEELVAYDPHLIVGILGGSAGTTYDAFKLLAEAQKYGARVALFGRKINNAECQPAFVRFLRLIVEGEISAEEAVRAYHGVLAKLGVRPRRSLEDDLQLQTAVMSYRSGSAAVPKSVPQSLPTRGTTEGGAAADGEKKKPGCGCGGDAKTGCGCKGKKHAAGQESGAKETPTDAVAGGEPDFAAMTTAEKLAYQQAKRDRIFGRY